MKNQKLELTWIGKHKRPKLEARILLEDAEKSYHAATRRENAEFEFDNRLIYGDNLLALKALEQEFAGKVKCVFIDPPYNTGSAFAHYDDGLEHSIWLGLMRDRLEIIKRLLADDGSLWITIDDNEAHYLKVLCDEIFGRGNFVASVIWEKKYSPQGNAQWLSDSHDFILVYAKQKISWITNLLPRTDEMNGRYKNPDNDPRGLWKAVDATISLSGGQRGAQYARTGVSPNLYELTTPSGRKIWPAKGRCWYYTPDRMQEAISDGRIWFGESGNNVPAVKKFLSEVKQGVSAKTIWFRTEVGDNQEAKQEAIVLNSASVFSTPKPERLLQRIIHLATNPGDLVLDSFAGSGTTGAVAHKMGRRWIMVELGEHCHTHIIPRLRKVIDGTDQGGISKAVNWQGGGGFRYYHLAPTLIVHDRWGNDIINPDYNPEMLAEAMAKLEGFTYQPSPTLWWQHGHSSENDYLYVTTQTLSTAQLQALAEEVGPGRSLLICCSAWRGITLQEAAERFPNLTLKKIPKMVRERCEWGHDDYSLNVANLPLAEADQPPQEPGSKQGGLFDDGEDGDA
jgi:adenine specific DNA methylase mod